MTSRAAEVYAMTVSIGERTRQDQSPICRLCTRVIRCMPRAKRCEGWEPMQSAPKAMAVAMTPDQFAADPYGGMPDPDAWDCRDGTPDEDHDWKFVSDWYGDPGVINGTADCSYWLCRACGKEDYERKPPSDR